MRFSDAYINDLVARNDIVDVISSYVDLSKKSGSNLFGLCPFHSEKSPSFSVSPAKQIYHCFGCGKGGGVISFIREQERMDFTEAVEFLAKRVGMPLPEYDPKERDRANRRQRLLELNRAAARHWYNNLVSQPGNPGLQYVAQRGIQPTWVKQFGLGYAPDSWDDLSKAMQAKGFSQEELITAGLMKRRDKGGGYDTFRGRLIFPVIDIRGNVIAFSGRIIGQGEPKYLNSPETPVFSKRSNLFAMNLAKKSQAGYVLLTEGNIDVVSLHQAGFDSAVASLGTSFTEEQAQLIKRFSDEVVLCYDGDNAGKKATERAIGILQKLDIRVRVLEMQGAKDPDEFIRANGADAFRNLLEGSAGQVDYQLRLIESRYPMDTQAGRVDYLKESVRFLATLPSAVEREVYAAKVAQKAEISLQGVLEDIKRASKTKRAKNPRPSVIHQPTGSKTQVYTDISSAMAEEELIALLYADPALCKRADLPSEEEFSSPLLAHIYMTLVQREKEGTILNPDILASELDSNEMSQFSRIINTKELELSQSEKLYRDYVNIIRQQKQKRNGEADLNAFAKQLREGPNNYQA